MAQVLRIGIWGPIKITLIALLLICNRPSLALYLWGRGKLMRRIAYRHDADKNMYRRPRWIETRKIVYWRNKRIAAEKLGTDRYFICEATGYYSDDLSLFQVDHILPRDGWPFLAYDPDNLRLILKNENIRKSNRLCGWSLLKFVLFKRIR